MQPKRTNEPFNIDFNWEGSGDITNNIGTQVTFNNRISYPDRVHGGH